MKKKEIAAVRKRRERKSLPTKERLARDLEDLKNPKLENIITRAREGFYDDYETPIATPAFALVCDLEEAGFLDLSKQAKEGRWDSTIKEGQKWFDEEGWGLLEADIIERLKKKRKR